MTSNDMDASGSYESATSDGFSVSSNGETAEQIKENFASEEKPKDGDSPDPEKDEAEKVSKAASELGKKGGKASAEKRAKTDDTGLDASDPDTGSVESEKPLGKPRDDPKARMLEATRKEAEAKRERDAARAESQRLAQELAQERAARQQPAAPQPKVNDPNAKPSVEDFDDYGEFVEANARWAARQEFQQAQQRSYAQHQAQIYAQSVDRAVGTYKERIDAAKAADPSFMDRVSSEVWDRLSPTFELDPAQTPTAFHVIADEIMESESAPAILLHFTEHPQEFQRIAALRTPRAISREMAKLETRFENAAPAQSRQSISKAPPPVRPVNGAPSAVDSDDDDSISFEEHTRKMNARDAQRRRGALAR